MENNLSNHNIKIVRLKDGLDVVCNCSFQSSKNNDENDIVEMETPMIFEIRNTNLVMQHWLPLAVMKERTAKIKMEEVLCILEPKDDFAEYYTNTVSRIDETINRKQSDEDDRMLMEALIELEHMNESNIH